MLCFGTFVAILPLKKVGLARSDALANIAKVYRPFIAQETRMAAIKSILLAVLELYLHLVKGG